MGTRLGIHVSRFRDHRALNCEVINLQRTSRIRFSLPHAITNLDDEQNDSTTYRFFFHLMMSVLINMFYISRFFLNILKPRKLNISQNHGYII